MIEKITSPMYCVVRNLLNRKKVQYWSVIIPYMLPVGHTQIPHKIKECAGIVVHFDSKYYYSKRLQPSIERESKCI